MESSGLCLSLSTRHESARLDGRAERGFSLLVVIAMLGVIAILAMALMPTGIRQLDLAARQREQDALKAMIAGLRNHILDSRSVPAATTVFTNIASKTGWEISTTRTNARGNPRVYLVDPGLRLGATTAASLPFTQGVYGITNVSGLRLMLISSLGEALPNVISDPGTNAATMFQMIWNTPDNTTPLGWSWGGNWADINVQRLSLVPMLSQVNLLNGSAQMGRFSVDNTNAPVALPTNTFTSLYFVRTMLGLHHHANSTANPTGLQVAQVLQDVTSLTNGLPYFLSPTFVYEDGQWRGRFYKGTQAQKHNGENLQWAYDIFMSGSANVYHAGSVNQSSVTMSMYLYMSNYVEWANSGFNSEQRSAVVSAQSTMSSQLTTYCDQRATVN